MIDKQFFQKHQNIILWFVNTKIGRFILGVEKMGHRVGERKINRITPNSIRCVKSETEDETEYTEQFHIYNEYSIKLAKILFWLPVVKKETETRTFVLRPAYQLAYIAIAVAIFHKTGIPVFMGTTSTFVPDTGSGSTTCDGRLTVEAATWANAQSNTAPLTNDVNLTEVTQGVRSLKISVVDWYIYRWLMTFDTSSITSSPTITSAKMTLTDNSAVQAIQNADSSACQILGSTPAANNTFAIADWSQFGTTVFGSINLSSIATNTANDYTFNGSGLSNISQTGISKFSVRNSLDTANTAPTGDNFNYFFSSDNGSNKPTLSVTYSVASTSSLRRRMMMGVGM